MMTTASEFRGPINVGIRDSVSDWTPFEPPQAPDGSPNVIYVVFDDVGFSAMGCYGGPVETPNIGAGRAFSQIAPAGIRVTAADGMLR